MRKDQVAKAREVARRSEEIGIGVYRSMETKFYGIALRDPNDPVLATYAECASFLRYQAMQFNGEWDLLALAEAEECLHTHCTIVDGGYTYIALHVGQVVGAYISEEEALYVNNLSVTKRSQEGDKVTARASDGAVYDILRIETSRPIGA